jgi:hypothetical protein
MVGYPDLTIRLPANGLNWSRPRAVQVNAQFYSVDKINKSYFSSARRNHNNMPLEQLLPRHERSKRVVMHRSDGQSLLNKRRHELVFLPMATSVGAA